MVLGMVRGHRAWHWPPSGGYLTIQLRVVAFKDNRHAQHCGGLPLLRSLAFLIPLDFWKKSEPAVSHCGLYDPQRVTHIERLIKPIRQGRPESTDIMTSVPTLRGRHSLSHAPNQNTNPFPNNKILAFHFSSHEINLCHSPPLIPKCPPMQS